MPVKRAYNFSNRRSQWPRALDGAGCGHSHAGIVGPNPAGGMDFCLLRMSCIASATGRSLIQGGTTERVCVHVCM